MRILLAGGAGFIGSRLGRRLVANGHHVIAFDNLLTGRRENCEEAESTGRLSFVFGDVCQPLRLSGRFDAVLHLASPASPIDYLRHPIETLDAGSMGTHNLLELAREHGARFLLASTSEVYGDPEIHPQHESYWGHVNPIGPRSVYDEAKRFAEAITAAYAREHGVGVHIARIFNTYGPGMRFHDGRIIPTFVHQALTGQPLSVFGDGSQTRSYCYVDDLVQGLEALLWSDVQGPINLGNPEEFTVLETARLVLALTGSQSTIVFRARPQDDPMRRRPDISLACERLGWNPTTPFGVGLDRTVEDLARDLSAERREAPLTAMMNPFERTSTNRPWSSI